MNIKDFKIREGILEQKDIQAIVHQRRAMFFAMGYRDERARAGVDEREVSAVGEAEDGSARVPGVVCDGARSNGGGGSGVVANGLAAAYRWGRKVARQYRECVHGNGVPQKRTGAGVDEDGHGMVRERRSRDGDPACE